jgi:hypothetical protein
MNLHSVLKDPRTGKRKNKSVHNPKIRVQLLGPTDPSSIDTTPSIEAIRQEVSSLARHSIGSNTSSRSMAQESRSLGRNHKSGAIRSKGRGAAEQAQGGA